VIPLSMRCHILITVPETGRQFPIMTSTAVTISIILDWSQIDAGSLIQVEMNEKYLEEYKRK